MKKRLQKSIITFVLAVAMVTGALPLPNITMVARAAEVTEIEIANWAALKDDSSAATVTTANGVTTITLNSCIKLTATLDIASDDYADTPYLLDLNGYGLRYAGTRDSVINPGWRCSSLTLKDSTPSRAIYYITLTDGRSTAVSNSAPSGTEGTDYLAVTGGYITGGNASIGGGVKADSFTMEGGTICGNKAGSDGGVYANNFTMSGGTISYNSATSETGGVSISNEGTALMTGGTIAHNSGPYTDVYNSRGTFVMTGGTIGYDGQSGYSVNNTGHFYLKSGSSAQYYGNFEVENTFGNAAQTISTVTVGSPTHGRITVSNPAWIDNTTNYCAEGDTVTLTITPDTGYEFGTITVTKASGGTVEVSGTGNTCTFTMPDDNVTVSATFTQPGVSYIDGNGETQSCTEYTILTGNETNSLAAGWYVVNSNITRSNGYGLDGDVNLILCDNASLKITGTSNGFNGTIGGTKYGLTVYGQSGSTGTMTIETTSDPILVKSLTVNGGKLILKSEREVFAINIVDGDLTVNGGSVTVDTKIDNSNAVRGTGSSKVVMNGGTLTATSGQGWCIANLKELECKGGTLTATGGINVPVKMTGGTLTAKQANTYAINDNVTFSGGELRAESGTDATYKGVSGAVTLDYTNADDSFFTSGWGGKTVTVADGKAFTTNGADLYTGTLTDEQKAAVAGKILHPAYTVQISDSITNGTVVAGPVAFQQDTFSSLSTVDKNVILTVTPNNDYVLSELTVTGSTCGTVTTIKENDTTYRFTMPAEDVIVNATFAKTLTDDMISNIAAQSYTGSAITPDPEVKDGDTTLTKDTDYTLSYRNNLNVAESTAENAPTVTVTGIGSYVGTVEKTFTISKADVPSSVVTAPTPKTGLSYTGEALELADPGSVTAGFGTMYYALTDSSVTVAPEFDGTSTAQNKKWSTSVPTAVDAGVYNVWYMVKGDSNHNDTEAAFVTAGIERQTVTGLKVFLSGWSYGTAPNTPYVTGNIGKGAVTYTYYTDEGCSTKTTEGNSGAASDGAVPSKVGTYYVKATVQKTKNYQSAAATAKFEIRKADMPDLKVAISGWNYGEEHKAPILSGVAEGADLSGVQYEFKKKGEPDSAYKKIEFLGTGTNDSGSRYDKVPDSEDKDSYKNTGVFLNTNEFYLNAGDYVLRATIPENADYMEITAVTEFTVERSKAVVEVTGPHREKTYDGNKLELTGNGTGTDTDQFSYTVKSINGKSDTTLPIFSLFDQSKLSVSEGNPPALVSRTDAGTSYMGLKAENLACTDPNYDVTFTVGQDGYVTIGKAEINTEDPNNANYYSKLMTISGLTDTVYSGEPVVVSVTNVNAGLGALIVKYQKKTGANTYGEASTEAPSEPGTYDVTLDVAAGINYAAKTGIELGDLTITKADYTGAKEINIYVPKSAVSAKVVLPNPPDTGCTYGQPSLSENLTACSVSNGYFYYTKDISENDSTTWKVTIPVTGSSRYNDYSLSVNFTAKEGKDAGLSIFWKVEVERANERTLKITYGVENPFFTSKMMNGEGSESISWNSSNPQVAEVDSSGEVTIKGTGKTMITATYESADSFGSTFVTLDVERKPVQITGLSAEDREYDGTAAMKVSGTPVLSGLLPRDENKVSIVSGTAFVQDADVGDDKKVYFSGFSISGEAAENYCLSYQPESVSAKITPREVWVSGITAKEREYSENDKTVKLVYTDSENASTIRLSGVLPSEENDVIPDASAAVGIMTDDKPGTDKTVTVTGLKLSGDAAKNYSLAPDSLKTRVTITKKGSDSVIPGPTEIGVVDESIYGKKDGKITGLTAAMEYRYQYGESNSFSSWMTCPEGELDQLSAGSWRFRYKETETQGPSAEVTVTVAAGGKIGQISGSIRLSDGSVPGAGTVSLKAKDQAGRTVDPGKISLTNNGSVCSYTISDLPYGYFTVEATYNTTGADGSAVSKTVSVLAETDSAPVESRDIVIPAEGENESRTEVGDLKDSGLSTVIVDGLDEAAKDSKFKNDLGNDVSITDSLLQLTITSGGNESEMSGTDTQKNEMNNILRAAGIEYDNSSSDQTKASFFEVDLKAIQEANGSETVITETGKVIELILPYDFTDRFDVLIWRYHSGEPEEFTRLSKRPAGSAQDPYVDKTWFADKQNGRIFIYTCKFSTYAVTYTTKAQYRITFLKNDGTDEKTNQVIEKGLSRNLLANNFSRNGYDFAGWNTAADGSGTAYSNEQSVSLTSDLMLYAQWAPIYPVTYRIVNGTWSDGTKTDKTESVVRGSNPVNVPTGMIPSNGYLGGTWDTNPADTTITVPMTFTYTFTVKPLATVTKAPTEKTLTYDGSSQDLITAGEANGGTLYYAVSIDATTAPTDAMYTTSIPKETAAGNYYVWYKVKGDLSHEDTTPKCITVYIEKNTIKITAVDKKSKKGEDIVPLTYTVSGKIMSGDNLNITLGTSATKDSPVGEYSIVVNYDNNDNYNVNTVNGKYIIEDVETTNTPIQNPNDDPVDDPTSENTPDPTQDPVSDPTDNPTSENTPDPSKNPVSDPVDDPASENTPDPSQNSTENPVSKPAKDQEPAKEPTKTPSQEPAKDHASDIATDLTQISTLDPNPMDPGDYGDVVDIVTTEDRKGNVYTHIVIEYSDGNVRETDITKKKNGNIVEKDIVRDSGKNIIQKSVLTVSTNKKGTETSVKTVINKDGSSENSRRTKTAAGKVTEKYYSLDRSGAGLFTVKTSYKSGGQITQVYELNLSGEAKLVWYETTGKKAKIPKEITVGDKKYRVVKTEQSLVTTKAGAGTGRIRLVAGMSTVRGITLQLEINFDEVPSKKAMKIWKLTLQNAKTVKVNISASTKKKYSSLKKSFNTRLKQIKTETDKVKFIRQKNN